MSDNDNFEEPVPAYIFDDGEQVKVLEWALGACVELHVSVAEEDLSSSSVNISGEKFCAIVDLLAAFAERYEGIDVEGLIDMINEERRWQTPIGFVEPTVH